MKKNVVVCTALLILALAILSCAGPSGWAVTDDPGNEAGKGDAAVLEQGAAAVPEESQAVREQTTALPEEAAGILTSFGIIGASVSDGFGLYNTDLSDVFDAAIRIPHKITLVASALFFMSPDSYCDFAINRLEKVEPTVVFGIDFFFWFAYGVEENLEDRQELLRRGCAFAERFECPFIAGDLPDVREAAGLMLLNEQIPSIEELEILNAQLHAWAAGRPSVHILPLSDWIVRLKQGKEVEVNGATRVFEKEEVMQWDNIHVNERGMAILVIKSLETLMEHHPAVGRKDLVLDMDELLDRVMKAKER